MSAVAKIISAPFKAVGSLLSPPKTPAPVALPPPPAPPPPAPPAPPPPPAPAPAPEPKPPAADDAAVEATRREALKEAGQRRGRASTILTGGQGLLGDAPVRRPRLVGG